MVKNLTIRNRMVQIITSGNPQDARLLIDGKNIPLLYNEGFKGWGVSHTIYGHFSDLERLADHMIISNPKLVIGHGHGDPKHDGGDPKND